MPSSPLSRGAGLLAQRRPDCSSSRGAGERSPRDPLLTRQALHAAVLGFKHPITGDPMEFQAPPPPDMARLIALLRQHRFLRAPTVAGAAVRLATGLGS